MLFDDSNKASERLHRLRGYQPEHVQTIHEFVGLTPDLVLIDESLSPETARELMEQWGLSVCLLAERVTIALRRKFPMVKDMVTDAKLDAYLEERSSSGQDDSQEKAKPDRSAHSIEPAPAKSEMAQPLAALPLPVSVSNGRSSTKRHAKIIGFVSLRNFSGGAGKSGVAFNYAAFAVKHGHKVLVIDIDPKGPLGRMSGAKQGLTTEHWCNLMNQQQGTSMTERAVFDNVERQQPYGFYMITSPSRDDMIYKHQLRWILEQTEPYFDLILFDMPAFWDMATVEMMHMADELMLFGQYDPFQYEEYQRSIEIVTNPLVGGMTKERLTVVIGRGHFGKNQAIELDVVKRQLGVDKALFIPEDPLYQQYRIQQKAIALEHPSAPCAKAMLPLFESAKEGPSTHLPALYEPSQKGGLFTRLFGGRKNPRKKAVKSG
ncbi:AAA family ATPase [Alicyclobacillus tolerans]|uniref:AAA family ATPase n=1 Tax=Alicyclobacillus tolerans TaxID=90970 RepID=UPI001F19F2F3|nr:AAA family ATPase [Alicyclobacillus tolerans]MCF8567441.1 AAA family ATPase [Alicyclobacillus tolerans]